MPEEVALEYPVRVAAHDVVKTFFELYSKLLPKAFTSIIFPLALASIFAFRCTIGHHLQVFVVLKRLNH